jgi:hypothetical protein
MAKIVLEVIVLIEKLLILLLHSSIFPFDLLFFIVIFRKHLLPTTQSASSPHSLRGALKVVVLMQMTL